MEKGIPSKWKSKKSGEAILLSDKIDLKIKTVTRDKEGHYIMIKGLIQEEDITIVNKYAPNVGAPQYIGNCLKEKINRNTITVGNLNTPLRSMDKTSRQKINKETQTLNDTLDQMNLIDIYKTFHPKAKYTFFSSAHGTSSRTDYMLGHKVSFGKFKKIEIVSSIFSDHNAMRLEVNYKEKNCKTKQKQTSGS